MLAKVRCAGVGLRWAQEKNQKPATRGSGWSPGKITLVAAAVSSFGQVIGMDLQVKWMRASKQASKQE